MTTRVDSAREKSSSSSSKKIERLLIKSLSLSLVFFLACTAGVPSLPQSVEVEVVQPALAQLNNQNLDYISPLEQQLEEIQSVNTRFIVDYSQDNIVQERIHMFFTYYLKNKALVSADKDIFQSSSELYEYKISRVLKKEKGVKYKIQCFNKQTKFSDQKSKLNAQNLSRFLQEGQLEVKLLAL